MLKFLPKITYISGFLHCYLDILLRMFLICVSNKFTTDTNRRLSFEFKKLHFVIRIGKIYLLLFTALLIFSAKFALMVESAFM